MKRFTCVWLMLLLVACIEENTPVSVNLADSDLDIILVMGQSNTHSGIGLDPALDASDDRVFQLGRFSQDNLVVIAGTEPLQHLSAQDGKIGFALSFAKQYVVDYLALDTNRNVIIIPAAEGGTGFGGNRWNKGNDLYEDAVSRTQYVLEGFPNSRLVCMLWHQGESDVGNQTYQLLLDQFIYDIRQDLYAYEIPFILGGMVPYWVGLSADRQAQQSIISGTIARVDLTGYADPTVPFVIEKPDNTFDDIHYDAAGQREIAFRYYWEYQRLSD